MESATVTAVREAGWNAWRTVLWSVILSAVCAAVLFLPPILVPASFFLRVEALRILPVGTIVAGTVIDEIAVLQRRFPRWDIRMEWRAAVYQVALAKADDKASQIVLRGVCYGTGDWVYREIPGPPDLPEEVPTSVGEAAQAFDAEHSTPEIVRLPQAGTAVLDIDVWTGDEHCPAKLRPGRTYIPYGQWTKELGPWSWTVEHTGEPTVLPERGETP